MGGARRVGGVEGIRAGAHGDINLITLLLGAEEGGLEVLHRNGQWLGVNPPAGSLVVNVGDMLQTYRQDPRLDGAVTFGMNAIVLRGADAVLRLGQRVTGTWAF